MSTPLVALFDAAQNQVAAPLNQSCIAPLSATSASGAVCAILRFDHGNAAVTQSKIMTFAGYVIDSWVIKLANGGAADSVQLKRGTSAITNVMDLSGTDKAVVRALTIDDAFQTFVIGDTLNSVAVDATNPSCQHYVLIART